MRHRPSTDELEQIDLLIDFGAASHAVRRACRSFGLEDFDIFAPRGRINYTYHGISIERAILDAIEPSELRRCPIVRRIVERATSAYGATAAHQLGWRAGA